jgi:hypothetical protein
MIQGPLDDSVTITLDGSGNGTAKITVPGTRYGGGPTWTVAQVAVKVLTNTLEATAQLYLSRGTSVFTQADFVSQTQLGSTGDTCALNVEAMQPNDWLSVTWTGGDPGQIATMTVKGIINVPSGS